jgi:Na+-driven multidrug efflux pump
VNQSVDKDTIKFWLTNGMVQFVAIGMTAIKALWDSYWLNLTDSVSGLAFGFAFPVLILINTVMAALVNAIMATLAKAHWVDEKQMDRAIFALLTGVSLLFGCLLSLIIWLAMPWIVVGLNAGNYSTALDQFAAVLIVWLPLQLLMATWMSVARGARLFKSAGAIAAVCYAIGMACSYVLLTHHQGIAPLSAVVYSNAVTSLLVALWLVVLLWRRIDFVFMIGISDFLQRAGRVSIQVFSHSFVANLFALLFIITMTRILSSQGEHVIAAMVYLTRFEQLILMVFVSFIGVILPQLSHLIRQQDFVQAEAYIQLAVKFLFGFGVLLIGLFYGMLLLLDPAVIGGPEVYGIFMWLAGFWFVGLAMQGVSILYLQVITIVVAPSLASKINFVRFVVLGTPFMLLASHYYGLMGFGCALVIIQLISLLVLQWQYQRRWPQFKAELTSQVI